MNLNDTQDRLRWMPIAILAAVAVLLFLLDGAGSLDGALSIVRDPIGGVLSFTSAQTDKITDALSGPRDLRQAQQEIEALEAQIAQLQRTNDELRGNQEEYELLVQMFDRQRASPNISRIAARVIAQDTSPTFRSIIIDQGSDDGVFVGMPVESARGLVGQVYRTSNNLAQVVLITDNTSSIPARLSASRATGIVHGGGVGGLLTMDWVNLDAQAVIGDIVLTSGLTAETPGGTVVNRFPADIVLGRVVEVRRSQAELFQQLVIQPVVDFGALESVFVIESFPSVDTTIFDEVPGGE